MLTTNEREELILQREELEQQIRDLKVKPLSSKSQSAANFRAEDLNKLAKKILGIDKKLGRI